MEIGSFFIKPGILNKRGKNWGNVMKSDVNTYRKLSVALPSKSDFFFFLILKMSIRGN